MILNIYLDVDGVLKGCVSPKEDIEKFIEFCLDNCVVYWLTTYCRGGVHYAPRALLEEFNEKLVGRLSKSVNQTDWISSKLEAIDFNTPFVWFDDNIAQYERDELKKRGAKDSFFWVDRNDPESARHMLEFVGKNYEQD